MLADESERFPHGSPESTTENTARDTVSPTVIEALIPVGVLISLLSFLFICLGLKLRPGADRTAREPPSRVCWDGGMGKPGRNSRPA